MSVTSCCKFSTSCRNDGGSAEAQRFANCAWPITGRFAAALHNAGRAVSKKSPVPRASNSNAICNASKISSLGPFGPRLVNSIWIQPANAVRALTSAVSCGAPGRPETRR